MVYVIDTNIFRELLSHLPKKGSYFEHIWDKIEMGFANKTLVSVDECYNELMKMYDKDSANAMWIIKYKDIFLSPSNQESLIIREIFKNKKMQESIHTKNIIENRPAADIYLVAKAEVLSATVVTTEKHKPQSAQLPNICESRNVPCINYEDFMAIITENKN